MNELTSRHVTASHCLKLRHKGMYCEGDSHPEEMALYLLPNAFPIRFLESGDLLHLHHKWVHRLCYTAQEEIWRSSLEEVLAVRQVQPELVRIIVNLGF